MFFQYYIFKYNNKNYFIFTHIQEEEEEKEKYEGNFFSEIFLFLINVF